MKTITEVVDQLPPQLRQEVCDFAEFLLATRSGGTAGKMSLSWAGALREYRDKFSSLDLQKKALSWWNG